MRRWPFFQFQRTLQSSTCCLVSCIFCQPEPGFSGDGCSSFYYCNFCVHSKTQGIVLCCCAGAGAGNASFIVPPVNLSLRIRVVRRKYVSTLDKNFVAEKIVIWCPKSYLLGLQSHFGGTLLNTRKLSVPPQTGTAVLKGLSLPASQPAPSRELLDLLVIWEECPVSGKSYPEWKRKIRQS